MLYLLIVVKHVFSSVELFFQRNKYSLSDLGYKVKQKKGELLNIKKAISSNKKAISL